jgi:hypothetical protein
MTTASLDAAQAHAATFTWASTAGHIRNMLEEVIAARRVKGRS